jgi:hypothetical protein
VGIWSVITITQYLWWVSCWLDGKPIGPYKIVALAGYFSCISNYYCILAVPIYLSFWLFSTTSCTNLTLTINNGKSVVINCRTVNPVLILPYILLCLVLEDPTVKKEFNLTWYCRNLNKLLCIINIPFTSTSSVLFLLLSLTF